MTDGGDIPAGNYSLELGSSFTDDQRKRNVAASSFHTLRYDFKPSSVTNESETYIAYGSGGDVHVALPSEGDSMTVFKGSKKEAKPKECLLFFDKRTNTVRLEKISSNIQVKKTRDLDAGTEASIRNGIERLRTSNSSARPPTPESDEHFDRHEKGSSSSSSSSSGSGSDSSSDDDSDTNNKKRDSDDSDVDDVENALLQKMNSSTVEQSSSRPDPTPAPEFSAPAQSTYSMPNFDNKSHSNAQRNDMKYGLTLSESSDDEDD